MDLTLLVVGLLVVVLAATAYLALTYNRLVTLRNRCENAWAQIDVQLKRRYDLVPNLVATVKGYAAHERETLEQVTAARAAAMGATGMAGRTAAENGLTTALRSLFAVAEAYPDLKANASFLDLQAQLVDTEGKIAYARQFFNDAVMTLNMAVQQFPGNLVAGAFGFEERAYFEIEASATEPVTVSL
ncbi:MAG TPA: LemA family protein [Coriobacteriia bacterium]